MALNLRICNDPGASLTFKIEQLKTGLIYDFTTNTFLSTTSPNSYLALPESTTEPGGYDLTLKNTPASIFTDGHYSIRVMQHDAKGTRTYYNYAVQMINGDDAPPETLGVVLKAFWQRLKGAIVVL